jgi:hypothetical protein
MFALTNNLTNGSNCFRLFFLLIFFVISINIKAQKVISANYMHDLDTILFMSELCSEDAKTHGLSVSSSRNELLVNYYNSELHGDTVNFTLISLINKKKSKYVSLVKNFGKEHATINAIAFNKNYIAFVTFDQVYFFERGKSFTNKYETVLTDKKDNYEQLAFTDDNTLLLSRCYNTVRAEKDHYVKVKLCTYDINRKSFVRCIEPHMINIALTHMDPIQLISANNKQIIVGQNAYYQFDIYGNQLESITKKDKPINDWKPIDTLLLKKLTYNAQNDLTPIFRYLQPKFMSGYSLCDYYCLVDETTLLVRYTLGKNASDSLERLIDVWRFRSGEWVCSDTTYKILAVNKRIEPTIITKQNFECNFWFNKTVYTSDYIVTFFKGSDIYPLGMELEEYNVKNYQFSAKRDPLMNIVILKRKY